MLTRSINLAKTCNDQYIESALPHVEGYETYLGQVNNIHVKVNERYNCRGHTISRLFKLTTKRGTAVGFIETINNRNNKFQVKLSGLHTAYQGKKLMSGIYRHLIDCGYKIKPGEAQTKGGRSIWKELNR